MCVALDVARMKVLSDMGYPLEYVEKVLKQNDANYCLAAYYLLGIDQNY